MADTAAGVLIDVLHEWGVDVVFGIPGDGINGIMEALRQRQDKVRFIHARHEEGAAFMACAYAKYTGRLGCCLGTSGPGGIHLLNGLYDAKLDGAPVVAITGHHFHDLIDTHSQQDVDLDRVFQDVALYSTRVMGKAHVENVANIACRTALTRRGVAHINFPTDLQDQEHGYRSKRNVRHHEGDVYAQRAGLPNETEMARAVEILNAGRKIAILAGQGALRATDELLAVAQKLGAPIAKALLGKGAVPDDHPYTTGGIGLVGTRPSQEALEECDTLLIVGSSFPYIEFYPEPGKVRAVQIDIDPTRIGLRYPVDVGLVGDAQRTLQLLLPRLRYNENRYFIEKAQSGMREWWRLMEERGTSRDKPMKPQVIAWELGKRLPDDAIVSCDSGTIATWYARQIPIRRGQKCSLSGTLATMANGLPYAIGAQVAYPDRMSVAFVGDGGFTMLMGEFATAVKYELPIKIFIVKNNVLGQIKWEQMVFLGNPEYGVSLNPINFAEFARACGGTGFTVEDPATCGDVVEQALRTPGPVVVEAVVDPLVPPLPPKITYEQAKKFTEALVRGQPQRAEIVRTVLAEKVRELI